jgi:hypothetical protein
VAEQIPSSECRGYRSRGSNPQTATALVCTGTVTVTFRILYRRVRWAPDRRSSTKPCDFERRTSSAGAHLRHARHQGSPIRSPRACCAWPPRSCGHAEAAGQARATGAVTLVLRLLDRDLEGVGVGDAPSCRPRSPNHAAARRGHSIRPSLPRQPRPLRRAACGPGDGSGGDRDVNRRVTFAG